jgi:hypothetical protein
MENKGASTTVGQGDPESCRHIASNDPDYGDCKDTRVEGSCQVQFWQTKDHGCAANVRRDVRVYNVSRLR